MNKLIGFILIIVGVFLCLLQISIWLNTPMILDNEGIWVTMGKLLNNFWAMLLGVLLFTLGFFKTFDD